MAFNFRTVKRSTRDKTRHYRRGGNLRAWYCLLVLLSMQFFRGAAHAHPPPLDTDRFGRISIEKSTDAPAMLAVWFDDERDSATASSLKSGLLEKGFLIATVKVARYLEGLPRDSCWGFGEIVRLAQVVQSNTGMPRMHRALVGGNGAGAAIAYAVLRSDPGSFSGLVAADFCPRMESGVPFCADQIGGKFDSSKRRIDLFPGRKVERVAVFARTGAVTGGCDPFDTGAFSSTFADAEILETSTGTPSMEVSVVEKFLRELRDEEAKEQPVSAALGDLDPVELPAASTSGKPLVILWSGDGGWAAIDRNLGEYFQTKEMSVVGISSLEFFWTERTPAETGDAIARLIEAYRGRWNPSKVILAGFSLGADVLPAAYNLLKPEVRARISTMLLLNPSNTVSFSVHLTDWLGVSDADTGVDALPEARRATLPLVCVYGREENDSLCRRLRGENVTVVELPGGHHFDGDYRELGEKLFKLIETPGTS